LLSHDDRGSYSADEAKEVRPQVPWIVNTGSFARDRERLARAGAGPDWSVVGPSCKPEGVAPSADTSEEMGLGEASEVIRCNIDN
jgi:hypothetical protein